MTKYTITHQHDIFNVFLIDISKIEVYYLRNIFSVFWILIILVYNVHKLVAVRYSYLKNEDLVEKLKQSVTD